MIRMTSVVATILLLAPQVACEPKQGGSGDGGGVKLCDTRVKAPTVVTEGGAVAVQAQSVSQCDIPPDTHKVTLRLEYLAGKNWIVQNTNPLEPYGICEKVPLPGKEVDCKWLVFICLDGQWRSRATVSGRGEAGNGRYKDFFFEVPERPEAKIKCPKGKP